MKKIITLVIIIFTLKTVGQVPLNPVKWDFSFEEGSGFEGYLVLTAKMDDKWHIYSQHQNADGPIPTSFTFTESKDYVKTGTVEEPAAEKSFSEVFGADVISFSDKVVFKQKIKRNNKKAFKIKGSLEFMSCNDNSCLPPKTVDFVIEVPLSSTAKTK